MRIRNFALAALLALSASPALAVWDDDVNAYDRDRLFRLEESRDRGLRAAERGAPRRDLAIIHGALDQPGRPITARELTGTWQCRTMKLGGLTPDIIYSWFRCRVRETRSGLFFEKLSGTERLSGYVEPYENGRFVLMAARTVKNEKPKPYSGANSGIGALTTSSDAVGVISSLGRGRARIEFPFPNLESDFDVIELRR